VPPQAGWCDLPCKDVPQSPYGLAANSQSRHVHHICWSCGEEVVSPGTTYECQACQVGAGPDFTSREVREFDPDFAARNSSPA